MIPRSTTGPIDELAATIVDTRSRLQTVELLAHRHRYDVDPTAWAAPALLNGWVNLGGIWQVAQYRKVGDVVQIRGILTAGVIGAAAFVLPVGFRPPAALLFATDSNGAYGQFSIAANGAVTPNVGVPAWFAIEGSFSVTP